MVTDIVQTAISTFDGVVFDRLAECPFCGGPVQGYDTRQKKFAVLIEAGHEHAIIIQVKRFTCRNCGRLSNADEPYYPGTRMGSVVIDLYTTLATIMPHSRAARVIAAMGICVERTTWRNYQDRRLPAMPVEDVFGIRLPLSILTLSSLAARIGEGGCIEGAEALAACGFPSAYRAAPDPSFTGEKRDKRDKQEEKEERHPCHP
ncbi:hypothetical protein [uncultured Methanoregula sp.]|uniref:hypothetical protein n=1 Tax=uncultured Methanoregula sp. TaxID=1005933 RepID=UPI00374994E0